MFGFPKIQGEDGAGIASVLSGRVGGERAGGYLGEEVVDSLALVSLSVFPSEGGID